MAKKKNPKKPVKRRPTRKEKTGPQTISFSPGLGLLTRDYSKVGTYAQLRAVRKDPTVQLARNLLISCIQAGSWNIEADEGVSEDVTEFLNHLLPLREDFIFNVVAYGKVDYGWMGFEKIFKTDGNRIMIESLKPLLHDITTILVTKRGHFNGYRQTAFGGSIGLGTLYDGAGGYGIDLFPEKCLHTYFGVEAGNLYGMPLLENIRQTCDDWSECNDGARRYDKKMAGCQWKMQFPKGEATIDGETVDNYDTAVKALANMQSGGSVVLPTTTIDELAQLTSKEAAEAYKWDVTLIEHKAKQDSFGKRLKYLDGNKVRGLMMPERAILEGQFGTKAESETHGDLMMNIVEATDRTIVRRVNQQLVNQLLVLNFGEALVDRVRIVAAPLVDEQLAFIRKIYEGLTDNDVDTAALRDKLNIPTKEGGSEGLKKTEIKNKENNDEPGSKSTNRSVDE